MKNACGLIVDDDRDLANFLKIVLGLAGFECETAHTPREALNILSSTEPDLIFLDLNLGSEIQGGDLIYHIRSNPRFDSTRVIVITGHPSLAQPVASLADLVLIKPVEIDQLSRLASRLLLMEVKPYEFHEPVTGLYNLKFFHSRLALAFDRSKRRPDFIYATLAIELEAPTEAEPLSESEWEQAMKETTVRWLGKFRPTDIFGRLGRRRVVALFEDLKQPEDVQVIIQRLKEDLLMPVELENRPVSLVACIGAVVGQAGYASAPDILEAVVHALGTAGLDGSQRSCVVYSLERQEKEQGD